MGADAGPGTSDGLPFLLGSQFTSRMKVTYVQAQNAWRHVEEAFAANDAPEAAAAIGRARLALDNLANASMAARGFDR